MNPRGTPQVVLVVEDEWTLRNTVVHEFRRASWQVLEAASGERAIAHIEAEPKIDVVFTDIQLAKRLNGWDVAEAFRSSRPDLPVIYTSGNSADRTRQVSNSTFFEKPYQVEHILAASKERLSAVAERAGEMHHYFLHIRNGTALLEDPDGADFADVAAARVEAIESARELISECVLMGSPMGLDRVFEIVNADGQILATVSFADAVVRD